LAAHMLVLARVDETLAAAHARLKRVLSTGQALECFRQNVKAQGGDPRVCDDPSSVLPLGSKSFTVESPRPGFLNSIDTTEVGNALAAIGGGRVRIEDAIDPTVGLITAAKLGEQIAKGQLLGTVFCRDEAQGREAVRRIQAAYSVADKAPTEIPELIKEVIE
jgi:thymidine phosphorylase